jgi:hypothetical protein
MSTWAGSAAAPERCRPSRPSERPCPASPASGPWPGPPPVPSAAAPAGGRARRPRRAGRSLVVAIAADDHGRELTRVHLQGPDPYTLTARLLAWAAIRAARGALNGTGALGPVDAFGLEALQAGAATAGLDRTAS